MLLLPAPTTNLFSQIEAFPLGQHSSSISAVATGPISMARPRRSLQATAEEASTPPAELDKGQAIAQVRKAEGKNLYTVELPNGKEPLLVELSARFRSTIWIKRGGFVVVDTSAFEDRENKLGGEIVNVIRDEKHWRKQAYWPAAFARKSTYLEDSNDEESTMGKMPPSEDDDSEPGS